MYLSIKNTMYLTGSIMQKEKIKLLETQISS